MKKNLIQTELDFVMSSLDASQIQAIVYTYALKYGIPATTEVLTKITRTLEKEFDLTTSKS